jgi:hypothetical protein
MTDATSARQLVEMVTSRPGYTSSLGTRVLLAEPGRVHLAVERRADLLQFSGLFHGGVIAGLADHAAGGAVTTMLPAGRIGVTPARSAGPQLRDGLRLHHPLSRPTASEGAVGARPSSPAGLGRARAPPSAS